MSKFTNANARDIALYVGEQMAGWLHSYDLNGNEVVVEIGGGMSKACYDWIKESMEGANRKEIGLMAFDSMSKPVVGSVFSQSLISDIQFPALDSSGKNAGSLRVKFRAAFKKAQNTFPSGKKTIPSPQQYKLLLPSSFRLQIDGLEDACRNVTRVETIQYKGVISEESSGSQRMPELVVTRSTDVPPLIIYVFGFGAEKFKAWMQDYIKGINLPRKGFLEYLSRDRVLFTLTFPEIGIYEIGSSSGEDRSLAKIKMWYEGMSFSAYASWS
jgi:hypothetical protein